MTSPPESQLPPVHPATLLSSNPHTLPNRLFVTELFFSVPLDYSSPHGRHIKIFCRSAERPPPALDDAEAKAKVSQKPWLVYIPGGPGFGCPCTAGYAGGCGGESGLLKRYRATEAVRDLVAIRLCLTQRDGVDGIGGRKWSIMGQSYGGFVCANYLSFYSEGLREVWVLGGLPPVMDRKPDGVIRGLVAKVRERNEQHYGKYPEDVQRVRQIVRYLKKKQEEGEEVRLPSGCRLSAGRFLEMGLYFRFHGRLDVVHNVILRVWNDLEADGEVDWPALGALERMGPFEESVLYAVLHEAIYCQGGAARWAFDRIMKQEDGFGVGGEKERYLFTGEMVFRRAFDDYAELRGLKEVADKLMLNDDWPDLHDIEQLKRNEVPVHAAVFVDDMYVGFESSLKTARLIRGYKTFISNQLYHDAVRGKPEEVLKSLFGLRDDYID